MFSDTTYADELFDIRLKFYDITAIEQAAEKVDLAIQEGADVLLGGDTVNALAAQKGIPAQFIVPQRSRSVPLSAWQKR